MPSVYSSKYQQKAQYHSLNYFNHGLNVIPIRADGTKAAMMKWQHLKDRKISRYELGRSFRSHCGIGIICGSTSENLEVLDFDFNCDVIFPQWIRTVSKQAPGLLKMLPIIRTPKGRRHIYYRCEATYPGQKLAMLPIDDEHSETLIETRGQGQYVLAPGSPASCHLWNKEYVVISGSLESIPVISDSYRSIFLDAARTYDQSPPPAPKQAATLYGDVWDLPQEGRPGDDFIRSMTWDHLMSRNGWTLHSESGGTQYWTRPGKLDGGISATTNHNESDLLYIFSTSVEGFESQRGYNKFSAYTILEHHGDFSSAARCLSEEGFGRQIDLEDDYFKETP